MILTSLGVKDVATFVTVMEPLRKTVIHMTNHDGYRFERLDCNRTWLKPKVPIAMALLLLTMEICSGKF